MEQRVPLSKCYMGDNVHWKINANMYCRLHTHTIPLESHCPIHTPPLADTHCIEPGLQSEHRTSMGIDPSRWFAFSFPSISAAGHSSTGGHMASFHFWQSAAAWEPNLDTRQAGLFYCQIEWDMDMIAPMLQQGQCCFGHPWEMSAQK